MTGVPARRSLPVELVDVAKLAPHPDNPRRGNLDAIRESLRANGWWGTIVAQRSTGHILVGNHRYTAAVAEGHTQIPTHWLDVDDDTARRILVADNRAGELATWDEEALVDLLGGFEDLTGTLFTAKDLERLLPKPPAEFGEVGDDIETDYTCPKCGYRWSGTT